ncbi:MAG: type IV pilus assembly protein PilA [Halioglobus sp.]|jgi:type IV pilus assembly protein PilA
MKLQQKSQGGFTLIELMIVIAIVGILAAIALPAYQDYIVRAKMSEPMAALAEAKTTVAEYVAANGGYPTSATSFGINTADRPSSDTIANLSLETPTAGEPVRVVANVALCTWDGSTCNDSSFLSFQLSGSTNSDGTMAWTCIPGDDGGDNEIPTKYLPANCRGS